MKKRVFAVLSCLLLLGSFQSALADDCVEVDIELTPEVAVGDSAGIIEAYFELTNCGDEADTIWLSLSIELWNGAIINLPAVPVLLGAGETISRDFRFPAPPAFVDSTFGLCVTATAGEAEASDCAYTTIVGNGTGDSDAGAQPFGFNLALGNAGCVEVELELPDTVVAEPGSFAEGYFELMNCGDTAALIQLELVITLMAQEFPVGQRRVLLGAGEIISHEFIFPIPPALPEGTVTFCVTATSGEAISTSCQTVVIVDGEMPGGSSGVIESRNFPNPFNPSTVISFNLPTPANVTLSIYNVLGQKVATLIDNQALEGPQEVEWSGEHLSSGVYFYRIETNDGVMTEKMVMLK